MHAQVEVTRGSKGSSQLGPHCRNDMGRRDEDRKVLLNLGRTDLHHEIFLQK